MMTFSVKQVLDAKQIIFAEEHTHGADLGPATFRRKGSPDAPAWLLLTATSIRQTTYPTCQLTAFAVLLFYLNGCNNIKEVEKKTSACFSICSHSIYKMSHQKTLLSVHVTIIPKDLF